MPIKVPVYIYNEGKYYVAIDPLSGTASQGRTLTETVTNIIEALELYYDKTCTDFTQLIFLIVELEDESNGSKEKDK